MEINASFRIMANIMVIVVVDRMEEEVYDLRSRLDSLSRVIRGSGFGSVGITAQPLIGGE